MKLPWHHASFPELVIGCTFWVEVIVSLHWRRLWQLWKNHFIVQQLVSSIGSSVHSSFSYAFIQERKQSEASISSRRISKQHEHKTARSLSSELTIAKESSSTPSSPLAIRSQSSSATGEELAGPDSRASPSRELSRLVCYVFESIIIARNTSLLGALFPSVIPHPSYLWLITVHLRDSVLYYSYSILSLKVHC